MKTSQLSKEATIKVRLIEWPDSQGCVGCKHGRLINSVNQDEQQMYICMLQIDTQFNTTNSGVECNCYTQCSETKEDKK